MNRFLEEGDRVKVMIQFRGREQQHIDLGAFAPHLPRYLSSAYLRASWGGPSRPLSPIFHSFACQADPLLVCSPPLHVHTTGHELLGKVGDDLKEVASREGDVRREGGRLIAMFKPKTNK